MRRFKLSDRAKAYVTAETGYLKARSPAAATKFRSLINGLKKNLTEFPHLGHAHTETVSAGVFRLVVDEYLVDYEVSGEVVNITAIRDGRQRPPSQQLDSDDDYEVT